MFKKIKEWYLEVKEAWFDMMEYRYGPVSNGLWIWSFVVALIGYGAVIFFPIYLIYRLIKKLRGKA